MLNDQPNSVFGLYAATDGKLLVSHRYEGQREKSGPGPRSTLTCYDFDGKLLWTVVAPKVPGDKDFHAENIMGEFNVPGLGHVLGSWLWHGSCLPYLITTDGLYVGRLLQVSRLGPTAAWDESYKYYFQTPNGTPYLVNGANDAQHFLKIVGLDQGGRFEASLKLSEEEVSAAAAARQRPLKKEPLRPIVRVDWLDSPPKIDGGLDDWNMAAGVTLAGSKGRIAVVALGRDERNLYLAYQVEDETPWINRGDNWQTLFISGDCVDLMLATDPPRRCPPQCRGGKRLASAHR